MSAPHTNVEKQVKRHKAPLMGIIGVLIFAGLLLLGLLFWLSSTGNEPETAETQIEVTPGVGAQTEDGQPVTEGTAGN